MIDNIDILMITYNRPGYTRLSLGRLLETCDSTMRVWVWQNGSDEATMNVVESFRGHPRFYEYYHSLENKKLNAPTNWLWGNSDAAYFSKVDDDCLVPDEWAQTLRKAHEDNPDFGIIGCWHFFPEDYVPELAARKIQTFQGGHSLMRSCWLGGSGYLMKRACYESLGPVPPDSGFTRYGIQLSLKNYICGWYYPFIYQEHMDDPRSEYTAIKTDEDIRNHMPLTAANFSIQSVRQWLEFLKNEAIVTQTSDIDPRNYIGWRRKIRNIKQRLSNWF